MVCKSAKDGWFLLMKFSSEENLQKLRSGQLYMKNLQYYVNFEKATEDQNIGDEFEGQVILENVNIRMYDYETGAFFTQMDAQTTSMNLGYLKCPVFCMFMFDYRNHTEEELTDDILRVRYQFTEEQLFKLPQFGSHVLIIKNGDEFMNRVKNGLLREGYGFTRDLVNYYDGNRIEHAREVAADEKRIAFWKRQKYAYQQEYRILIDAQVDDYLSVDIGDLRDITELVTTSNLLNTYTEVTFRTQLDVE